MLCSGTRQKAITSEIFRVMSVEKYIIKKLFMHTPR
jgi:hypothetical protein